MLARIRELLSAPTFENEEDALASSLLHTILLILAGAGFVVPLILNVVAALDPNDDIPVDFGTLIMGIVVPALALSLLQVARRGRVRLASAIMTGTIFLLTTSTIATFRGTRDTAAGMFILVIAMAGLLLGGRAAIVFTALSLVVSFAVYYAEVSGILSFTLSDTPGIVEWLIFAVVVFLVGILLRFAFVTLNRALNQAREANEELEKIQESLADRVAARTRDLELAAEIGRSVSRIRESDEILLEAVEVIRSRFDLYYTQIYLVDGARNNLALRAGTGAVGRQLRQLGHRLPLSKSSINGTAVITKAPVIVSNTAESAIFRQNPLLPDTRSEMAIPLIVLDNVIGSLNLQSVHPGGLTEENLPAFEALAGQLAVALDNARLFTETAEAQDALEALAQRLTRTGWDSYLNAVERQENITYTYDLTGNRFVEAAVAAKDVSSFNVPIRLGQERLGKIEVRGNEWNVWQKEHTELAEAVAQRVAQQIENLRLLSETEKYRSEAEEATRRLTREGWEEYIEKQPALQEGYLYDRQEVVPLTGDNGRTTKPFLVKPLMVRGEPIGRLEIEGLSPDSDEAVSELMEAVAQRLSAHIENLRLTNQTEAALTETERRAKELAVVNEIAQAVSQQIEPKELLATVYEQIQRVVPVDAFTVTSFDHVEKITTYLLVMDEGKQFYQPPTALGSGAISRVLVEGHPILLNRTQEELDELYAKQDAVLIGNQQRYSASLLFVPLKIGTNIIGAMSIQSYELNAFRDSDVELLVSIANHVAVALENAHLFEETQTTLAETELLYKIGTLINRAVTLQDLVNVIDLPGIAPGAQSAGLFRFDLDAEGRAEWMELEANWTGLGRPALPIGARLYLPEIPLAVEAFYTSDEPMLIADIDEDKRVDDEARSLLKGSNTRAMAVIPMRQAETWIGTLIIRWSEPYAFSPQEGRLYNSLSRQMSTALSNQLLLSETQDRAAQLELINRIDTALSQADDEFGIVEALALLLDDDSRSISLHYTAEEDHPETIFTVAHWENGRLQNDDKFLYKMFALQNHAGFTLGLEHPNRVSYISDVRADDHVARAVADEAEKFGFRSVLVVPLRSAGRWQGFVSVKWQGPHEFTAAEISIWEQLRESLAAIISTRRAYLAQQEALSETAVLYETGAQLSVARSYNEVLTVVRKNSVLGQNVANVSIMLFEHGVERGDQATYADVLAFWSPAMPEQARTRFHFGDYPSANKILAEALSGPLVFNDVANSAELDENLKQMLVKGFNTDTYVLFPMLVRGEWIGYVNAMYPHPTTLSAKDIRRTEAIIRQVGIAIEGLRNLEQAEHQALVALNRSNELASINRVVSTIVSTFDLDDMLNSVAGELLDLFSVQHVAISLLTTDRTALSIVADRSHNKNGVSMVGIDVPLADNELSRLVLETRQSVVVEDAQNNPLLEAGHEVMRWRGTQALVLLPLISGRETIGTVGMDIGDVNRTFTDSDMQLAETIVAQIATAVENVRLFEQTETRAQELAVLNERSARLFEQAQARSEELAILNEMGRSLTALVDMDSILDNVYRYTSRLMDTTNFYIGFFDMKRGEITFALDIRGERVMRNAGTRKMGKGLTEHIIQSKEPLLIPENVDDKLAALGIEPIGPQAASWLGVPMMVGSQVIGVIGLQNLETANTYNEQHLRLLTSVAGQAAIAIENARLFEQIQARARRERILREVTAKVRGATDADSVMRTAVQEIGRALGRQTFVYLNQKDLPQIEPAKEEAYGD